MQKSAASGKRGGTMNALDKAQRNSGAAHVVLTGSDSGNSAALQVALSKQAKAARLQKKSGAAAKK